ncbi:S8 family serine peptidase [Actinoplanes sp. NPDC026619]|uniref:S8 family serine peptidase n=1 Tax=Actinoplanes sp. NPDC026619 TaxID=3155798 RepID=UPI003405BF33
MDPYALSATSTGEGTSFMQLTKRRLAVGLISTTVVAAMTGVATWANAAVTGGPATTAAPVRLVIGYKSDTIPTSATQSFSAAGVRAQSLDQLRAATVQVSASRSAGLIASLKSDPNVAYVEVDHVRKMAETTPDDPIYGEGYQPELKELNVPTAWDTTTGSAVNVAVLDTGVNAGTNGVDDLSGALLGGYDFVNNDSNAADDEGHGSEVASLIAARGNNSLGMAGVCWSCQILPVKVLDYKGDGYDSTIAKGITWAVQHGAKIINMSLGGVQSSQVLSDAVAYANASSVLVVAAAGNSNSTTKQYPAAYTDVLAVGATARCPNWQSNVGCTEGITGKASFSSYNSSTVKWVDVAAPGTVYNKDSNGNYSSGQSGTSFSAPLVTGVAALMKSNKPSLTGWSLLSQIQASATPIPGTWVTYGKVNAAKALTMSSETTPPTISGLSPAQNAKVRGTVTFTPVNLTDVGSGVRSITLWVDGVFKSGTYKAPWALKWNSAGRNGTAKVSFRVFDKAGNQRYYDRVVIADNTAPTVKVTKAPANKAKIKGTVKIYYTGSDKYGIKNYQLIINGKVVSTHTNTAAFSFVASKYPKSSIKVQVRAYDVAGNSKITSTLTYHR